MSPGSQGGVKKNPKPQHVHLVQRPVTATSTCYGLSQLWEQVADPFPWSLSCLALCAEPRWDGVSLFYATTVCFSQHPHHHTPSLAVFLSLSQVMFQVGWQSTACSHRQSRKFVSSVQKHVLTVCATSGGLFTRQSHSSRQPHDTICMTGSVLTPWNSKTVVTNETKKKRGQPRQLCAGGSWERCWHRRKSRAELSLVIQAKKQKVTTWQL